MFWRSICVGLFVIPLAWAAPTNEAVEMKMPDGVLKGTLSVPEGKGPFQVAIIHAGSGPTDRDGNQPIAIKTDGLKMLATELTAKGIATLRIDKRAIGESLKPRTEESLSIDIYSDDLAAWAEFVRKDKRFSKVIAIGHSEGSLIGLVAMGKARWDAFVSLCGPGLTFGNTLRMQLKPKLPAELFERSEKLIAELEAGRTVKDTPKELAALFRPSVQPFLISAFKHDPAKLIGKLEIPTLIVQGTSDIQVTSEHAKRLSEANKKATVATIDKMSHTLKRAETMKDQQATYTDPKLPLAAGLVDAIAGFILGTADKGR